MCCFRPVWRPGWYSGLIHARPISASLHDSWRVRVHSRLNKLDRLEMVFPPQAMTTPTHNYLLRGFALVLALAIMIGVPFAIILEWLVIFPLRRMVTDLIAFTRDPYRQGQGEIIPTHHNILNEARQALDTMTTATRNELVQRDNLAALGEAVAKINHDMRNVLATAVPSRTVWKTARTRKSPVPDRLSRRRSSGRSICAVICCSI